LLRTRSNPRYRPRRYARTGAETGPRVPG